MRPVLGTAMLLLATLFAFPASQASASDDCTIRGTAGDDVLIGTRRRDVICGLGGADTIRARGGDDVVYGGAGADRLLGGRGIDRIVGGSGADHLDGGRGFNRLDGGNGDDWCVFGIDDVRRSCQWDKEKPELVDFIELPPVVDVSGGAQVVTLRVRVRDDSAVGRIQGFLHDRDVVGSGLWQSHYELVSGSYRDGWWEITQTIPAGFPVSDLDWTVTLTDVKGRWFHSDSLDVLHVDDDDADLLPPRVSILSPESPTTFDVRTSSRTVVVKARIVDPETGVAPDQLMICGEPIGCDETPVRISGDRYDGVWRGELAIPKGHATGDLTFHVYATDRARPDAYLVHMGDDDYVEARYLSGGGSPEFHLVEGGLMHRIQGPQVTTVPELESFAMSTPEVTPTASGTPVEFAVEASNAALVEVVLMHPAGDDAWTRRIPLTLDDGVWRGTWLVKDQPDHWLGDYHPVIRIADHAADPFLSDIGHTRYAASPAANALIGTGFPELAGNPVLTVSDPTP